MNEIENAHQPSGPQSYSISHRSYNGDTCLVVDLILRRLLPQQHSYIFLDPEVIDALAVSQACNSSLVLPISRIQMFQKPRDTEQDHPCI